MRFLIDAQLPPGLCAWFEEQGFATEHVANVLGGQTPDAAVVDFAERNGLILVSKDDDFVTRFPGRSYRLLWLRCGNITNRALSIWLGDRWAAIRQRLEAGEALIEVR
jgi:predicted nuclease of predicted toxin-antitoxin system